MFAGWGKLLGRVKMLAAIPEATSEPLALEGLNYLRQQRGSLREWAHTPQFRLEPRFYQVSAGNLWQM